MKEFEEIIHLSSSKVQNKNIFTLKVFNDKQLTHILLIKRFLLDFYLDFRIGHTYPHTAVLKKPQIKSAMHLHYAWLLLTHILVLVQHSFGEFYHKNILHTCAPSRELAIQHFFPTTRAGSPFMLFANNGNGQRAITKWSSPKDEWNIASVPRSIVPHLRPRNGSHTVPDRPAPVEDDDEAFLERMRALKANNTGRMLWFESADLTHYPPFVDKALKMFNLKQVAYEIENSIMSKVSCTACKTGAGLLQHYIQVGKKTDEIIKTMYQFCVNLKIQSPRVCEGVCQLFGVEIVYVLKRITIGPEEICSFVIGETCGDVYNPYHDWEVDFPPVPKPELRDLPVPDEGVPTFKVLHISDTHYDPYYAEGSNADCNEPLCCRLTNGRPSNPNNAAGKWGDYRKCDTPKRLVDNMLEHIADTHRVGIVFVEL